MKQPELGKKIAELRKNKQLTQEDLVEKCNVNVRTIQRIESGEVTPRPSTLRIITEALDGDFETFFEEQPDEGFLASALVLNDVHQNKRTKNILQAAWIIGIFYLVIGLVEGATEYLLFEGYLSLGQKLFYSVVKLAVLIGYFFFIRGFVVIGKLYNNYMLRIASYLMMGAYTVVIGIDIFHILEPMEEILYLSVQSGASITVGGIGIIFGVGLIRLNKELAGLSLFAGVLELLVAFFFLTVVLFFLGLIILFPATLLEIVILYKVYDQMSNVQK